MTTLWATIAVISILVFVHELGHYLAARSVGVRVERFSVGFPPRLISFTSIPRGWEFRLFFYRRSGATWQWGPVFTTIISRPRKKGSGTEYCLALIPIGGYVKMAGILDESLDASFSNKPDELMSKPNWAQAWVMSAGVIMNIITAILLFSGIAFHTGMPIARDVPVIDKVLPDMPAESIGLISGDRITSVNGTPVATWNEMSEIIHKFPEQDIQLTWERDGVMMDSHVTTTYQVTVIEGELDTLGAIGIYAIVDYRDINIGEALGLGFRSTAGSLSLIGSSLKMLVTGQASIKELGGPIMVAQMAGETARAGWLPLLAFTAFFSVNLAFINVLPIPGLDGGHILITIIQAIVRRPLPMKVRLAIQQAGMVLLLMLFITVIYNDISRLFTG